MLETAIIGAGPYGLSIAAHFRSRGIPFRIFGRLMDSWLAHMPKGMCLKSDGFASNIYDPEDDFTLQRFCAQQGIEYSDAGIPVRLDTFSCLWSGVQGTEGSGTGRQDGHQPGSFAGGISSGT